MEVLQDGEELVFLYQLEPGKTDTSYACHIAAMMGLAPELVQRGAKVQTYIMKKVFQCNILANNQHHLASSTLSIKLGN